MSKAVLISIQPKWCELILRGKKALEVRKSRPKIETPFKCYIYQTKGKERLLDILKDGDENYGEIYHGKPVFIKTFGEESGYKGLFGRTQKIVGEFICDEIERVDIPYPAYQAELDKRYIEQSCVSYYELHRYLGHDDGYFWHISNFKIYDVPKELSEFEGLRKTKFGYESVEIKRPPQSWCYVEEREDNV